MAESQEGALERGGAPPGQGQHGLLFPKAVGAGEEGGGVGTPGGHSACVFSNAGRVTGTRCCWAGLGLSSPQMPLLHPSPRLLGLPWAVLWAVPSLSLSDLIISEPVANLEDLAYMPTAYACPSQRSPCTKLPPHRTGFIPKAVLGTAPATAVLLTRAEQTANLGTP